MKTQKEILSGYSQIFNIILKNVHSVNNKGQISRDIHQRSVKPVGIYKPKKLESHTLQIAFAGPYSDWSQRNTVFKHGLEDRGDEVIELHTYPIFTRGRQRRLARINLPNVVVVLYTLLIAAEVVLSFVTLARHVRVLSNSDVILAPNGADYSVFALVAWGAILNCPVAFDPHGTVYYSQIVNRGHFDRDSVIGQLLHRLDEAAARFVDVYIVYSEYMGNTLQTEFGLNGEKIQVVYTGVDEARFERSVSEEPEVDVLYWGTFISFHGVDLVLRAASKLNDVQFVFLGDSDNRGEYEAIGDELGIPNVVFPGKIPQDELVAYIKSADLVLGKFRDNPYSEFTVTNKIAEAAFMSKPVLTSESPAIKEVFTQGESAILCSPESSESIIEEINQFYNGQYDGERIGTNASEQYRKMLSPNQAGERLAQAFRAVKDT